MTDIVDRLDALDGTFDIGVILGRAKEGAAEIRRLRAQLDEERTRSREVNWLRARVAEQARMLARVATQCDEVLRTLEQPARKAVAEIGRHAEQRTTAEERPQVGGGEFYYGHGSYLVITQEDGKFHERPMTAVERAAVAPAGDMAADIYRFSNYAGVCYIWIWERMIKAFAAFVSPEEHDRRVTELLAANNREVERRREAEGDAPFAPTHRHYKGGLYQLLCWGCLEADMSPVAIYRNEVGSVFARPQKEWAGQVDGNARFEVIEPGKQVAP